MQTVDLTIFPNTPGWQVIHDGNNNMYYIENENGNRKNGTWTVRRFAEKALFDMLADHNLKDSRPQVVESYKKKIKKSQEG